MTGPSPRGRTVSPTTPGRTRCGTFASTNVRWRRGAGHHVCVPVADVQEAFGAECRRACLPAQRARLAPLAPHRLLQVPPVRCGLSLSHKNTVVKYRELRRQGLALAQERGGARLAHCPTVPTCLPCRQNSSLPRSGTCAHGCTGGTSPVKRQCLPPAPACPPAAFHGSTFFVLLLAPHPAHFVLPAGEHPLCTTLPAHPARSTPTCRPHEPRTLSRL